MKAGVTNKQRMTLLKFASSIGTDREVGAAVLTALGEVDHLRELCRVAHDNLAETADGPTLLMRDLRQVRAPAGGIWR
jgi:hypothetical protein